MPNPGTRQGASKQRLATFFILMAVCFLFLQSLKQNISTSYLVEAAGVELEYFPL
jgi:hypothetical protein